MTVVQDTPEGAVLVVHVQPRAATTAYVGSHGGALKFRVAAPPADGAANRALCAYLAERLAVSQSAVAVESGHGSRRKRIRLRGVSAARVRQVLATG